jgi:hypothetical protein
MHWFADNPKQHKLNSQLDSSNLVFAVATAHAGQKQP